MPLSSLGFISPYEKLYGHAPSLSHLRPFGCLCYVSTLKQGRKKFYPCADPCVFLGYPFAHKAYRVYNLSTHKITGSRDIIFHESHFPFHDHISSQSLSPPLYLPAHTPLPDNLPYSTPSLTL